MTVTWRLIRSGSLTAAENMAWDESLLQSVADGNSPPVLRLYRWNPAALSLGYGQRDLENIDLQACRRLNVDVVRRITGGRAVFHDREITYAFIAPVTGCFQGGVMECYRVVAGALQRALEHLGLRAELVPRRTLNLQRGRSGGGNPAVCFTAPSQFELVIDGRKVAGSAQKRSGKAFLQHGSLPVDLDMDVLSHLFPSREGNGPWGIQGREQIGWLNRGLEEPLGLDDLEKAMIKGFGGIDSIRWEERGLSEQERASAQNLQVKYLDRGWTEAGVWPRKPGTDLTEPP